MLGASTLWWKRFFATLTKEPLVDGIFATRADASRAVFEFIEIWYNRQRWSLNTRLPTPELRAQPFCTPLMVSKGKDDRSQNSTQWHQKYRYEQDGCAPSEGATELQQTTPASWMWKKPEELFVKKEMNYDKSYRNAESR